MPGLGPGIHVLISGSKSWMAGTSPAMTMRLVMSKQSASLESHHQRQLLRRARHARIQPALAALRKRERLVEQHHVVPLRALRFVHREHIAEVELVVLLALRPFERLDRAV